MVRCRPHALPIPPIYNLINLQLVSKGTNQIVAQSHSRVRSSFFRKPRDMSLEISAPVSPAMDIVLLTFIFVWRERRSEKAKNFCDMYPCLGFSPLSVED